MTKLVAPQPAPRCLPISLFLHHPIELQGWRLGFSKKQDICGEMCGRLAAPAKVQNAESEPELSDFLGGPIQPCRMEKSNAYIKTRYSKDMPVTCTEAHVCSVCNACGARTVNTAKSLVPAYNTCPHSVAHWNLTNHGCDKKLKSVNCNFTIFVPNFVHGASNEGRGSRRIMCIALCPFWSQGWCFRVCHQRGPQGDAKQMWRGIKHGPRYEHFACISFKTT